MDAEKDINRARSREMDLHKSLMNATARCKKVEQEILSHQELFARERAAWEEESLEQD